MTEREWEAVARESGGADQADSVSATDPSDPEELRGLLKAARGEVEQQREAADEYRGLAQRVQADFLNYKRRIEAEQETRAEAVRAETIRAFLPLVDDLERALEHLPAKAAREGWVQGFQLIGRNLETTFERLGVRRVGAVGEEFNPNLHEAVAYEEHPSVQEGHIAAVMRPGYLLGERVVRPAQVTVARAPSAGASGSDVWPDHRPRTGSSNGEAHESDLDRRRNIERA